MFEYENALDFEHIDNLNDACKKLSQLTNLLNRAIMLEQEYKQEIMEKCSQYEGMEKLSWDNKMVKLMNLTETSLPKQWREAKIAHTKILNKQQEVYEDIKVLKKIADITP